MKIYSSGVDKCPVVDLYLEEASTFVMFFSAAMLISNITNVNDVECGWTAVNFSVHN